MAAFKERKVVSALLKKGFTLLSNNKHHKYYEFWHNGKLIASTHTSHNGQDIDDYLIGRMSKQCLLNKSEFKDLVNCPLTHAKYLEILKAAGNLD